MRTISELPFRERRAIELLHLEEPGEVDLSYTGFGWAHMDAIWLLDARERAVGDALVLALHSADDGEALADDIELEFELAPNDSVLVLASAFLATWLPRPLPIWWPSSRINCSAGISEITVSSTATARSPYVANCASEIGRAHV